MDNHTPQTGWPACKTQRPLEQEVYLELVITYELLSSDLTRLCKNFGISPFQLNVLRILRGAGPAGLPCLAIADRMLNREPDITRLIDRLEATALVERAKTPDDRRVVLVRLTGNGLRLLAAMDKPLVAMHKSQLCHMPVPELLELQRLLTLAREGLEASDGTPEDNA
jgi:DNA-binding MarR family transcriptional regulator